MSPLNTGVSFCWRYVTHPFFEEDNFGFFFPSKWTYSGVLTAEDPPFSEQVVQIQKKTDQATAPEPIKPGSSLHSPNQSHASKTHGPGPLSFTLFNMTRLLTGEFWTLSPDFDFLFFLGSAPGVPHASFGGLVAETAVVTGGLRAAHSWKTGPQQRKNNTSKTQMSSSWSNTFWKLWVYLKISILAHFTSEK